MAVHSCVETVLPPRGTRLATIGKPLTLERPISGIAVCTEPAESAKTRATAALQHRRLVFRGKTRATVGGALCRAPLQRPAVHINRRKIVYTDPNSQSRAGVRPDY